MQTNNKGGATRFKNTPPTSWHILIVILLGAIGLVTTLYFLAGDINMNGRREARWAVTDSTSLVDTLHVVVRPNISIHKTPHVNLDASVHWSYTNLYMSYNPIFLVWMALISVMVACSLALLPIIVRSISDVYLLFAMRPYHWISSFLLTMLVGFFILQTNKHPYVLMLFDIMKKGEILLHHPQWLNYLVLICLCAGLVAMTGQMLLNHAIAFLPKNIISQTKQQQKQAAANFMLLRNKLKFFLMVDAVLIVFSILTTDALRRAVNQELQLTNAVKHELFPQEFVFLYGLVFTFYLGLLYLPIYYRLKYKGETMIQNIQQGEEDNSKLADCFLIKESPIDSFKVTLSILAPVVSSLLPGLLKI